VTILSTDSRRQQTHNIILLDNFCSHRNNNHW